MDGKETMDRTYGPILTSMANANSNANQSITSSADRRAARGGGPRNQFGQNVKVTSNMSKQTTEPTTQQTTEPTTQQTTSVPKYQQNRNNLNQQRQQQQLQRQQEISRNKPQSERTFFRCTSSTTKTFWKYRDIISRVRNFYYRIKTCW